MTVLAEQVSSPAPPSPYADTVREYCAVWIEPDDDEEHLATHNCTLPPLHTANHACGKCDRTWPLSPAERVAALDDLERRARDLVDKSDASAQEAVDGALADIDEALNIATRAAHSRRITNRLLEKPRKVLSPTEVIPSVQRAPGLDAIATAAQRLVRRMSKEIGSSSTTAWRLELPTLETRIATRLEDAGLSPAAALRAAHAITGDVHSEAGFAEEFIRTRVTNVVEADVARNLLPRISKLLKEPHHG